MVSHELSTLIPTIRSRCLKIKLNKHSYENFKMLINHINEISEEEIKFYYDLTYGCPGNAISFHDINMLEILDITAKTFNSNKIDINTINLTNTLSKLDNDQFKLYLSILKTLLIILNKFSRRDFNSNIFLSEKFKLLKNLTNILSFQNIIDRFDFLSNNESDLLTYNLDKKLFMLKFLTI